MMYLLDTNIVSEMRKASGSAKPLGEGIDRNVKGWLERAFPHPASICR